MFIAIRIIGAVGILAGLVSAGGSCAHGALPPEALAAGGCVMAGCLAIPVAAVLGPELFRPRTRVPGFDARTADCHWPPDEIAAVLEDFALEWPSEAQRPRVRACIDALTIQCRPGLAWVDEVGRTVAGLNRRSHFVEVADAYPVRLSGLAHEVGHDVARDLFDDADHAHALAVVWDTVERVRGKQ